MWPLMARGAHTSLATPTPRRARGVPQLDLTRACRRCDHGAATGGRPAAAFGPADVQPPAAVPAPTLPPAPSSFLSTLACSPCSLMGGGQAAPASAPAGWPPGPTARLTRSVPTLTLILAHDLALQPHRAFFPPPRGWPAAAAALRPAAPLLAAAPPFRSPLLPCAHPSACLFHSHPLGFWRGCKPAPHWKGSRGKEGVEKVGPAAHAGD